VPDVHSLRGKKEGGLASLSSEKRGMTPMPRRHQGERILAADAMEAVRISSLGGKEGFMSACRTRPARAAV